jgi:hypothetical protein
MSALTRAEQTTARLQRAMAKGVSLPIPGGWEIRVDHQSAQSVTRQTAPEAALPNKTPATSRQQLEYEREGGGAPSQRGKARASFTNSQVHRTSDLKEVDNMAKNSPRTRLVIGVWLSAVIILMAASIVFGARWSTMALVLLTSAAPMAVALLLGFGGRARTMTTHELLYSVHTDQDGQS